MEWIRRGKIYIAMTILTLGQFAPIITIAEHEWRPPIPHVCVMSHELYRCLLKIIWSDKKLHDIRRTLLVNRGLGVSVKLLSYLLSGADYAVYGIKVCEHMVRLSLHCLCLLFQKTNFVTDHDDVINGNIIRVTGPLCGEFIGHGWIPRTKASDAELSCFLWSASE